MSAVELGDFRRAEAALQRAVAATSIARTDQQQLHANAHPAVVSRGFLAISLAMRGQFSEARQAIEEELRLAEMTGQPNLLVLACIHAGRVLSLQGEFDLSTEAWERGLRLAREWTLTMQVAGLTALSGFAHTWVGRRDRGATLLGEAMAALSPRQPAFL
jgi:hypothetical protein